ncbi:MAG: FecR family protein [Bacteroidales bacterium]|nr:FecR family protein [Bacteroidales bacterium]MDD2424400.1 FecR family protein [Bacteroidales bacterium]MDD3988982.1 FecR family protein [Bacteroidales bacterium]MDD4638788.1 FecR family protein [Bacteroidales bacterium]
MEQRIIIEEIKRKFLQRKASEEEKRLLFKYFEENNEDYQNFLTKDIDWTLSNFPDTEAPKGKVESFMSNIRKKISVPIFYKIAAILALPLIGLIIYQYVHFSNKINILKQKSFANSQIVPVQKGSTFEYKVNPGVKGLIDLPDGSRVWLNSNSTLKCPQQFGKEKREVELNGEGYFIVESNEQWPMYIKTLSGYTVKVTGTEFNLSSYENDKNMKLTMVSGKVKLINDLSNKEFDVNKLEEVTIADNNQIFVRERNKTNQIMNTGWKDGFLLFDNTPMEEVVRKMERWYGAKITIKDSTILNNRFTGEFESESLVQVLEFMKITSGIKFSVKDKVYILTAG